MSKLGQFKFYHKVFTHLNQAPPTATEHYLRTEESDRMFCIRFKNDQLGFDFPTIKGIPMSFKGANVSIHGATLEEAHDNTKRALRFVQQADIVVEKFIAICVSDKDPTAHGWRGMRSGEKEVMCVVYEVFTKTTRTIANVTTADYYDLKECVIRKPPHHWQVIPYTQEAESFLIETHAAMRAMRKNVEERFSSPESIQMLIEGKIPLIGSVK